MDCITVVAYTLTWLDEIIECSELWHIDPKWNCRVVAFSFYDTHK